LLIWLFANVVGHFTLGKMKVSYGNDEKPLIQEEVCAPIEAPDSLIKAESKIE